MRKSQYQKPRRGAFSNCPFCGGDGCLACPGERLKAEKHECVRCGGSLAPPTLPRHCVRCSKMLCFACQLDNKHCPDCESALERQATAVVTQDEPPPTLPTCDDLHDVVVAIRLEIERIKKLHDPQEQIDKCNRLEAQVRQLQIDHGWAMTGAESRIAKVRLTAKQTLRALKAARGEKTHQGIILGQGDSPTGSLTIMYLTSGEILWDADMRYFIRCGQKQFFAAWKWLENQAAGMDRSTIRVLHKDYDRDWSVTRRSEISEGDMLKRRLQWCYNPTPRPADWPDPPGTSLSSMIRGLLKLAHYHAKQGSHADAPVFYADLMRIFRDLYADHLVFGCVPTDARGQLWNPERWVADMGLEVIKRRSYRYVQPDDRRLAEKWKASRVMLLQALEQATGDKRTRTILSELEDRDWLPIGYLPSKDGNPWRH